MKRIFLFIFAVSVFFSVPAAAEEKMQIAVLDLQPKGVTKTVAGAASSIIRSEMVRTGHFAVVERSQMDAIFKEQGLQQLGCTDQACAVEMGKMLSARKILIGEVTKIGTSMIITVRIVDVEKGRSDFAAKEKADNEESLDRAGENITRKLVQNILGYAPEYSVEARTTKGYYARAVVPGWGQLYADKNIKGYAFSGLFAASAGFTVYSFINYKSMEKKYNDVPRGAPQSEFDSKLNDKKSAGNLFLYGSIFTGAVYLANWIDILFFSVPDFSDKTALNTYENHINISFNPSPLMFNAGPEVRLGLTAHF